MRMATGGEWGPNSQQMCQEAAAYSLVFALAPELTRVAESFTATSQQAIQLLNPDTATITTKQSA